MQDEPYRDVTSPSPRESDARFTWPPELDRMWDALTKRGMHYDRESMEHDDSDLAERHRASLAIALGEAGWVPRVEAEALAEALEEIKQDCEALLPGVAWNLAHKKSSAALAAYRSRHLKEAS